MLLKDHRGEHRYVATEQSGTMRTNIELNQISALLQPKWNIIMTNLNKDTTVCW